LQRVLLAGKLELPFKVLQPTKLAQKMRSYLRNCLLTASVYYFV